MVIKRGKQNGSNRKNGGKSKAADKRSVGRPTDYKTEFVDQVRKLALLGARDKDIAEFFGVSESTLNLWKKAHAEFSESMGTGKNMADATVAESLFKRANGYSHPDVHVSNYQGEVTLTTLTKHYPPDTQAASLWLRNRQPTLWRDKVEHELYGKALDSIKTNWGPHPPGKKTLKFEPFHGRSRGPNQK